MLTLKKSVLITVAVIVLITAALGVGAGVAAAYVPSSNGKIIVIDAGHGGIDAGVYGVESGVKESEINLAIAKLLQGKFVNAGFRVVMTRKTQAGLYGTKSKGFKMRDMKKRRQIIEESNPDMVISVHQNYCPLPSRRGGQVFYNPESESGKKLAECVQAELNALAGDGKKTSALIGDYYLLKCSESPSVIVECGFLSNPDDDKLLNDDAYRESVAYAVFKGALFYFC